MDESHSHGRELGESFDPIVSIYTLPYNYAQA